MSRAAIAVLATVFLFTACGGSDEALTQPTTSEDDDVSQADDDVADDVAAPTGDDVAVPADDDLAAPTGDDDATMDDDVAVPADDVGDDDVAAPADDVSDDDVAVPADDDPAADDDTPPFQPAPVDEPNSVGIACESDTDCMGMETCLNESNPYFGGVYPNGVCTQSCTDVDTPCPLGTGCIGSEVEAWCAPLCEIGGTDATKCRMDQTCFPADPTNLIGYCNALCRDDLDCPDGLLCEPASGLCKAMPIEGKAVGEVCTTNEECEGQFCLIAQADDTEGFCTQFCNLTAELTPCGVLRDSDEPAPGACDGFTSIVVSGLPLGPSDMGICTPTCDLDEGCLLAGWTCAELVPEAQTIVGHEGLCLFEELVAEPADAGAP